MKPFEWTEANSNAAAAGTVTIADAMVVTNGQRKVSDPTVVKAGGLDLLDLMKEGLLQPRRVVNLRGIAGIDQIAVQDDGALRLGALATLARLAADPLVQPYAALADAARSAASPQIRNVATLGGNLLQRPRCWYFRSIHHHCARKGGETCFAFGGENQYHAIFDHRGCAIVHPSTLATALVAFGARIELTNAQGIRRESALEEFFVLPSKDLHRENDLRAGEIVSAILLPRLSPGARSAHLKQAEKDSFDWPVADVAAVLETDARGVCRRASIVLGAAAPVPHRARAAETTLLGKPINEETARAAARAALNGAAPLTRNAYKLPIFEAVVRRAILAAGAA